MKIKIWIVANGKEIVLREVDEHVYGEDCDDFGCYGDDSDDSTVHQKFSDFGCRYEMHDAPGQCRSLDQLIEPKPGSNIRIKARISGRFTQIVEDICCLRDDVWRREINFESEWDDDFGALFVEARKRGWTPRPKNGKKP